MIKNRTIKISGKNIRIAKCSPVAAFGLYTIVNYHLEPFWHIREQCLAFVRQVKINKMDPEGVIVRKATKADAKYASQIAEETERSAIARGSGIAKRTPESIVSKMMDGKAVIAVTGNGEWAGFSYFEVWAEGEFISNSGLIVSPLFRNSGVAKAIKKKVFSLGRRRYPAAKVFSITTGLAIMKMNARLGFEPVTYNEIPKEQAFWKGCGSCVNYDVLKSQGFKNCLCTAMLYRPIVRAGKKQVTTSGKAVRP